MRRKPSRGKSIIHAMFASLLMVFLFIVEARELVNEDRDVDAEAKIDLSEYMTIGETTTAGLEKARDTIQWRLESSAFELRLILEERMRGMAFLKAINAKLEELYVEDEGDGEGEDEDEGEGES